MDTAFPQKIPFILDRNLAKANCTEDRVCTSCDKVVLGDSKNCNPAPLLGFIALIHKIPQFSSRNMLLGVLT